MAMEDTTKYGTSTVLLTSVSDAEEKPKELEGFPCISPMDDGELTVYWFHSWQSRREFVNDRTIILFWQLRGLISGHFCESYSIRILLLFNSFRYAPYKSVPV